MRFLGIQVLLQLLVKNQDIIKDLLSKKKNSKPSYELYACYVPNIRASQLQVTY